MSDSFERACAVADVPDEGVIATEVGGVEAATGLLDQARATFARASQTAERIADEEGRVKILLRVAGRAAAGGVLDSNRSI